MVRLNNHGMTDRWINKGEIIGYLTIQKAPPQISCTEIRKIDPTMVSACQETASSDGGEGALTSEISEQASSTVELITTHQAEQTDHPPLRGIPGVNMPIQYPRRWTREETPEERKKRRAENAEMCYKEHRPWPLMYGDPCFVCNPPKSLKQTDMRRYCRPIAKPTQEIEVIEPPNTDILPMPNLELDVNAVEVIDAIPWLVPKNQPKEEETEPVYIPQEPCEEEVNVPIECILQEEEEDGHQQEIDKSIAELNETIHNPNESLEVKTSQQLFNQDPLRKVLNVAPVEQESREIDQILTEEINHQRKIGDRIEELQTERMQEMEVKMKPSEFRTKVLQEVGCMDEQVPLSDQFLAWLFYEQSKDEACLLLGKEMDRHNAGLPKKELKQNEVESNI